MRSIFNSLSNRIAAGYGIMMVLLGLTVIITLRQVARVQEANEQLDVVRMPVVQASVQLLNGVNHASAALRGWVFVRDSTYITERREAVRTEIEPALESVRQLLPLSSDPTATMRLRQLTEKIDSLLIHQSATEEAENPRIGAQLVTDRSSPAGREARAVIGALVEKQRELMRKDLDNIDAQVRFLNSLQWMILTIGLALGVSLAVMITRSIMKPVTRAVTLADGIAQGDLDARVDIGGSRELEVLGNALISMRNALKARMTESYRHTWLSDGQRFLDDVLRGEKPANTLAREVVAALAEYTGARTGAIYLVDDQNEELRVFGGFALSDEVPRIFKVGEGLVGQAAMDGKVRLLKDVDQDQLRISSTMIDAPARNILVSPFKFEDELLGVIELGKLAPFADEELEFLNNAMRSVGIAFKAAFNREEINALLEETQRQSEELQVQQEELQQTNEELHEQAERLKVQQEELQVANEELEEQTQAVAQRNAALESARQEVERKAEQLELTSRYKSEFLANMSHELRTPLNSLLILSNHLAKNRQGNLRADQVESARVIAKSGHDLLNLINDILDLSKVEAGRLDLHHADVKADVFAQEIRTAFEHVAKEKGLHLDVLVEPSTPATVWTDQNRLGQIIKNLLSNAIKFTDEGGVKVTFSGHSGGGWEITVKDSGIGIPKEKQQLIFEAFQQVDGSTSRRYGGTGLGLSIARELANLLGGHISVSSTEGEGSNFTLTIPARAPEHVPQNERSTFPPQQHKAQQRSTATPSAAGHGHADTEAHSLLIIEDDEAFANVLAGQAQERGFKVYKAGTGEEGLKLVRQHRVHAILLDLDLPGIKGQDVLEELKGDPYLRHIPVHILSAKERSLEPIRAGAVEYLEKPISQHQLDEAFTRIEDLLERKMKNLLIVEDNPDQRHAIKQLIGNGDVRYLEAGSAEEGLALLKQNPVDCIVLDIGLPDVSGFQLLKMFKDNMGGAIPPIIVYTGKELTPEENDELRMYAETIIVKGIRSEERLLDETALFLHRAVKDLPPQKQEVIMDLHDPDSALHGRTVLLVDDDMRNVFALNKILESKDMEVLRAENGRIALEILEKTPAVDMVLMDIMMPEMDGYTAIREIRKHRQWEDLPIIALTAKAMKEDRKKCIDAGANDYISKPVDETRLFSLMRIWMRKEKA